MTVTIKYGITSSITREIDGDTTADDLITSEVIAALGAPESAQILRNNVALSGDEYLNNGDILVLERQASRKA